MQNASIVFQCIELVLPFLFPPCINIIYLKNIKYTGNQCTPSNLFLNKKCLMVRNYFLRTTFKAVKIKTLICNLIYNFFNLSSLYFLVPCDWSHILFFSTLNLGSYNNYLTFSSLLALLFFNIYSNF